MTDMFQEYIATSNSARPCYSDLKNYGCEGRYRKIIPPTPVTVQPALFNLMKPHSLPKAEIQQGKPSGCFPYKQLGDTCRVCYTK